ncbi:MAG: DUF4105 domain-containing protein [Bacteroidales bacterium]|nr:DUF4105 domain-containing protein [Bacteroidales bacterium]
MKKSLTILLTLCLAFFGAKAQQQSQLPLSPTAWAGLLTCEPSNELYTSFSHSALHICDTASGIDVVYNYGTFDFSTPHFVWKFATRTLDYCISRESYRSFIYDYTCQRRAVWEQRLRLTPQEVCNLFLMLEFNYQPEYRWYRYDFFRDNCATRIRDIVCKSLDHREIAYPTTDCTGKSYRNIVYTTNEKTKLWWRFAIDLALGARCDRDRSTWERAFLPLEMMRQFDTLTFSGSGERIADHPVLLLQDRREPLKMSVSPTITFWLLFFAVAVLTILGRRKGWSLAWLDIPIFLLPALLSLLALFLWFCSAHWCAKWNLNLLWVSPLFFYLAGARTRWSKVCTGKRQSTAFRLVAFIQIALLLAVIGMMATGWPQQFNRAVLPIALILFTRIMADLASLSRSRQLGSN